MMTDFQDQYDAFFGDQLTIKNTFDGLFLGPDPVKAIQNVHRFKILETVLMLNDPKLKLTADEIDEIASESVNRVKILYDTLNSTDDVSAIDQVDILDFNSLKTYLKHDEAQLLLLYQTVLV